VRGSTANGKKRVVFLSGRRAKKETPLKRTKKKREVNS